MAASDPTPYVATPTGTLQGVAAFSWDGSAWQPSGRAGPDVATPTGVLQGVAAFNGGPAWQPSGQAQPGVATPTGVLDGVAVYTWSGSAWTPPGGTETPSTPSGALRGVAAFNWDGAAWQPAAQARPSVPTPYGVLDGVAMFNWSGTAWAAVGAPSLSLDFMTSGTLDPRITFTRASTGTYFDSSGTMQTAATNAPRWDYDPSTLGLRGLLIEEARTNLLLNSAALGTQSATTTATATTLSFYGTGTITKSGTASGALVGTGAQRVSQTFTPTAGTLTLTVTGSVLNAQLEAGAFPTSYIPTTAATVTRAVDIAAMTGTNFSSWFNNATGSLSVDVSFPAVTTAVAITTRLTELSDGTTANFLSLLPAWQSTQYQLASTIATVAGTALLANTPVPTAGQIVKACASWGTNRALCVNASPVVTTPGGIATVSQINLGNRPDGLRGGAVHIKRLRFWPRVLSNAEMQAATT